MAQAPVATRGDDSRAASGQALELGVVIPTYQEAANVADLIARLDVALAGVAWEAIFVDDDSPDGTAEAVRRAARVDRRIRVLHRIGRRGLSTAVVEGLLASAAPVLAVIDADLQHDERILPEMLARLRREDADVVVGSRYLAGGGVGDWSRRRVAISRAATWIGRKAIGVTLSDPMSGFFMLRRGVLEAAAPRLSGRGFKILLDLLASAPQPLRVIEAPYQFRNRFRGESKLDAAAAMAFGLLVLDKTLGRYVPVPFLLFSAVGALGLAVHLTVLFATLRGAGAEFAVAQTVATVVAMTFNFVVNNELTYRDRRLRGWRLLRGWFSFAAACSVGAVANVGVAVYAHAAMAGADLSWVWSAVAGALVGAVWNYAVTAVYTWSPKS